MASFKKHTSKNGVTTWRAQLFINGVRDSKCSFKSKSDAKLWSATREAQILSKATLPVTASAVQNLTPISVSITHKTLSDVFDRYAREVRAAVKIPINRMSKLCTDAKRFAAVRCCLMPFNGVWV